MRSCRRDQSSGRRKIDPVHPGQTLRPALLRRGMLADLQRRRRGFGGGAMGGHHDLHRFDARQRLQSAFGSGLHRSKGTRLLGIGGFQHESHRAAVNLQRAHQIARDQRAAARAGNPCKNPFHRFARNRHRFTPAQAPGRFGRFAAKGKGRFTICSNIQRSIWRC